MTATIKELLSKALIKQTDVKLLEISNFDFVQDSDGQFASIILEIVKRTRSNDKGDLLDIISALADIFQALKGCKNITLVVPDLHLSDNLNIAEGVKDDRVNAVDLSKKMGAIFGQGCLHHFFMRATGKSIPNSYGVYLVLSGLQMCKMSLVNLTLDNVGMTQDQLRILCGEFLEDNFVLTSLNIENNDDLSNDDIVTILLPCLRKINSVQKLSVASESRPAGIKEVDEYNNTAPKRKHKAAFIVLENKAQAVEVINDIMCSTITYPTSIERVMPPTPLSSLTPTECAGYHPIWAYHEERGHMSASVCFLFKHKHECMAKYVIDVHFKSREELRRAVTDPMISEGDGIMWSRRPKRLVFSRGSEMSPRLVEARDIELAMISSAQTWCANADVDFEWKVTATLNN